MRLQRTLNISLTVLVFLGLASVGLFVFTSSYLRFWETIIDFGVSVKYYFCTLFEIENPTQATIVDYSKIIVWDTVLPEDFEAFKSGATEFFRLLVDKDNFLSWLKDFGISVGGISKILCIILPCVLVLLLVIKRLYSSTNTKHNIDTVPLRIFKGVSSVTYQPVKQFMAQYICFVREHDWIWKLWVAILVFHLNLASVILAFFAFYFYFAVSFDFGNIYVQFAKLFIDLQIISRNIPIWALVLVAYMIFHSWRKRFARSRLQHFEARNCGFINELPIVSMSCGSMGKKKTTLITDMALSQEVMFRQKALEILQKADMKFPYFPWISFENQLRTCMEYGTVYNLATVKEFVQKKRERFCRCGNVHSQLYGYDIVRYGSDFNDALSVKDLFDVLETYALAYFIYVIESSLLVANYSIRVDNYPITEGNFPMWVMDFFPEGITNGRHAHILDFDVLRLGKKVIENNPNAGSFEFGVVVITEIGKERGNNLELKEVKKGTDETNQKNDLFNAWLKMCRHSATVDNFPFIKVFADEQRPESWGADARDLCDIVHIASSGNQRITLPFYTIEEMLTEWAFNKFISIYYDFRYRRGDNTLLVHLLKGITAFLWRRNIRFYNKYGYSVLKIEKERGTMDGKLENKKYYLMNPKIYARRFSTDCFSDYFNDMAKKTKIGLNDYTEYVTEKATVDELKMQNSYFINALYKNNP